MCAAVFFEICKPRLAQPSAARADPSGEMLAHAVRNEEIRVFWPAVGTLGRTHLFHAKRLAVGRACILLRGRAIGDMAIDNDQGGSLGLVLENFEGAGKHLKVVGITDPRYIPVVSDETCGDILAEGQGRMSLDRDVVIVVDPAQVRELEVSGKRGGLGRDAFHHAAVSCERIDVVVE